MTTLGQLCLLVALVGSGYAAFACTMGWRSGHRGVVRSGLTAALAALLALTAATGILAWALLQKDFRFAYVAQYCDRLLPWHYALSAFWVGQAGSLLCWAWMLAAIAAAFRYWPRRSADDGAGVREPAFGLLMAYLCFLVALMVFGADPLAPGLSVPRDGAGLGPQLQHPAMLVHPPVVFLGYACWSVPFALALAALIFGRLDTAWLRQARPWAFLSWTILGLGILLGADWAYEELGWGGYWSWDPVENASLLPWLAGTAFIHAALAWQYRGGLKKTTMLLAAATFGLCNFAAFLTRSGFFSSLHAFSESSIGWMFLALMAALALGSAVLVIGRRAALAGEHPIAGLWTREALVAAALAGLTLLTVAVLAGTLSGPLSGIVLGRTITIGEAFYNQMLVPVGLLLLAATALAPLVRWGAPPTRAQRRMLWASAGAGLAAAGIALLLGVRHLLALGVAGMAALAFCTFFAALMHEAWQRGKGVRNLLCEAPGGPFRQKVPDPFSALAGSRRKYAAFLAHLGLTCLAVGIAGSSLAACRHEAIMGEGETIEWAGHAIRYAGLVRRDVPGKFIVEAKLDVTPSGAAPFTLLPAQHLHLLQNQWTTEVAIRSTWTADFYTVLHSGRTNDRVSLTFVYNPLMRWLWLSGWVAGGAALVGLWPARRRGKGVRNLLPERPSGCCAQKVPDPFSAANTTARPT